MNKINMCTSVQLEKRVMGAKYQDIVRWIENQIEEGNILPGERIPSEHVLSERFQVTRQTVRHAIGVLSDECVLEKVQGSGTYVRGKLQMNMEGRNTIAFMTTYVDGYIFPKIIQGIERKLSDNGYLVQIAFTNNRFDREKAVLEDVLQRDEIAGVIAEPTKSSLPNPNVALYQELRKKQIPVLFINSFYPELSMPHVSLDDCEAGRVAASYLIMRGHREIGGIFKADDGQGRLRYAGFVAALREANISINDKHFLWIDTTDVKDFTQNREKVLHRFADCTGIVCYNDEVAYACKEILQAAGKKIPEDISLVGIDNAELAQLSDVPLTTINHPKDILGEKAADVLLEMMQTQRQDVSYEFAPELVERNSVSTNKEYIEKEERQEKL